MDIRTLQYVVTLAEELHFGRAAQRHFISAQPFGQYVQRLEREVGTRLFERTSRRVRLTPAGARFVERAREVLAELDRLRDSPPRMTSARRPAPAGRHPGLRCRGSMGRPARSGAAATAGSEARVSRADLRGSVRRGAAGRGGCCPCPVRGGARRARLRAGAVLAAGGRGAGLVRFGRRGVLTVGDLADSGGWRGRPGAAGLVGGFRPRPRCARVRHPGAIPTAVATTGRAVPARRGGCHVIPATRCPLCARRRPAGGDRCRHPQRRSPPRRGRVPPGGASLRPRSRRCT